MFNNCFKHEPEPVRMSSLGLLEVKNEENVKTSLVFLRQSKTNLPIWGSTTKFKFLISNFLLGIVPLSDRKKFVNFQKKNIKFKVPIIKKKLCCACPARVQIRRFFRMTHKNIPDRQHGARFENLKGEISIHLS